MIYNVLEKRKQELDDISKGKQIYGENLLFIYYNPYFDGIQYFLLVHSYCKLLFYFKGMNDVHLHSFLGRCSDDALESIFPTSDKQFITSDELKAMNRPYPSGHSI